MRINGYHNISLLTAVAWTSQPRGPLFSRHVEAGGEGCAEPYAAG